MSTCRIISSTESTGLVLKSELKRWIYATKTVGDVGGKGGFSTNLEILTFSELLAFLEYALETIPADPKTKIGNIIALIRNNQNMIF